MSERSSSKSPHSPVTIKVDECLRAVLLSCCVCLREVTKYNIISHMFSHLDQDTDRERLLRELEGAPSFEARLRLTKAACRKHVGADGGTRTHDIKGQESQESNN